MQWSTLVLSHSALKVEFLGTLFIRFIFYLLPSYVFLLFDVGVPSLAVNIKEHGEVAIATSEDHKKGRWWRVALLSTLNVILGVTLQTGVDFLFTKVIHIRSALKVTTTLPVPWGIAKDIVRGLLLRDVSPLHFLLTTGLLLTFEQAFTYLLHRYILHSSSSPLNSLHASYFHSLPAPYSLTAHYDHPVAYVMRVFLPAYLPAVIFRFHLLTYHAYLSIISLEELFAYSGYNVLPSGFILGGIARRQERHLMGGGQGNYSTYGLLDLLAGTSLGNDVIDDAREEAERNQLGKKAKSKAKQVGRRAKRDKD